MMAKSISIALIAMAVVALAVFWLSSFHIVYKPTAAELFGCQENYINAQGEDTGECQ